MKQSEKKSWWKEVEKIMLIFSVVSMIVLASLYFFSPTSEFVQNLITDLFSVALLFTLSQIFLKNLQTLRAQEDTDLLASKLFEIMTTQNDKLNRIISSGIADTHEVLPFAETKKMMARAKKNIMILHTFIDDPRQYKEAFSSAIKNKCQIRILLLNPESPHAKQRSIDVWPEGSINAPDDQFVSNQILYAINVLHEMTASGEIKNLEVRVYDSLPSTAMYIIDDHIIFGFFFLRTKTDSASQIHVTGDTYLSHDLRNEFETKWRNSKTVIKK